MHDQHTPILVTGAHRTGTTWVGKMLNASGQTAYISEPLNQWHRPGVMRAPVGYWYTYICPQNEVEYLPAIQETLCLRYHTWAEIKSLRSGKDLLRMGRDWSIFQKGRIRRQRPLLKDPFAVFSVPWFAGRLGCQVVITVRHPAAFASSLKRLNWTFDYKDLLAQPLLMHDWLEPFREDMEELATRGRLSVNDQDVINQSSLLWRMIYQVVRAFQQKYPQLLIVRHEELSVDPVQEFKTLYARLGLQFTPDVERTILISSSSENPKELFKRSVHSVRLDSQANLQNWKRRLSPEEIQRIRQITEEVAALYYDDLEWE